MRDERIRPGATMSAAWYERFGPAHEVLTVGEVPVPQPRPGEVLVAVAFSGINPHDTKKRSGWIGLPMPAPRVIPHGDGSGTVVAAGDGVDNARIGERVWFYRADAERPGHGSAAGSVAIPAGQAVTLPDGVPLDVGAGLGVPAMTAYSAVFCDGPVAGQTVLVQGGAGAVGSYALQMARHGGARVLATVSSPAKAALARELGAELAIDYRHEKVIEAVLAAAPKGVDRIIEVDFGANVAIDSAVIAEHGVIASYSSTRVREPVLPYYPFAFKGATLHFVQGMITRPAERDAAQRHITGLLAAGRLVHPPVHRFPLARIAEAHDAVEHATLAGKVVVALAED